MQIRAVPLRVASMSMRVHDSPGDFEAELPWRFFSFARAGENFRQRVVAFTARLLEQRASGQFCFVLRAVCLIVSQLHPRLGSALRSEYSLDREAIRERNLSHSPLPSHYP